MKLALKIAKRPSNVWHHLSVKWKKMDFTLAVNVKKHPNGIGKVIILYSYVLRF